MKDRSNRVSRHDLADAVASAIELESQRIEQLHASVIDHVSGGTYSQTSPTTPNYPPDGTTVGYFPTDPTTNSGTDN